MGLGEIYFYILTGLVSFYSFFNWLSIEDVKLWKFFRNMTIVSFLILLFGLFLVKFNLTFLSPYRTIYIYSSPIVLLWLNRILFIIHNRLFGEPFVYGRGGELDEGFWYNKTIDEQKITLINKIYYFYYSFLHVLKIYLVLSFFY